MQVNLQRGLASCKHESSWGLVLGTTYEMQFGMNGSDHPSCASKPAARGVEAMGVPPLREVGPELRLAVLRWRLLAPDAVAQDQEGQPEHPEGMIGA